ncbi:FecR domain-containing protein [Chitinophaga sp. MM2321]|uniref:FecR family protein n=1 Tax=Chitinophaga sp. MM2321 TaxID=3137178 RepID=UPI0032D589AC
MEYNKEHIDRLMMEKLVGTISGEEDLYLEELIRKDEGVRDLWENIVSRMDTPESSVVLQQIDEEKAWQKWDKKYGGIAATPLRRITIYGSLIAASVLLLLTVGLHFFRQQHPAAAPLSVNRVADTAAVKLTLGNGKEVALSGRANQQLQVGSLQLNIAQQKFSFNSSDPLSTEMNTLTVPAGYDYRIELADGTEVWLNAVSNLRFPSAFPKKQREVYLDGEAYFKIAANAESPFIVHTAQLTIKVLGTEFNVNAYEDGPVKTSLVKGSVAVSTKDDRPVIIRPGYQGIALPAGNITVDKFDERTELSWMQGHYYFKKRTIREIAITIQRWYNIQVVFDNPAAANLQLSGLLRRNSPVTDFLDNLRTTADIDYYFKDGVLHLK